jgi:hypothetical protein
VSSGDGKLPRDEGGNEGNMGGGAV